MLNNFSCYLVLLCSLSACASDPMFESLERAEKNFNQRQQQKVLIFMGLDDMFPDKQVRALAKAAGKGDIKKINELISSGVDVNAQGRSKATPLFWAIHKENLTGFEALLKAGATPNVRFDDSGTVMHWAARNKDSRFLELALAYGGDPNLRGAMYESPAIWETVEMDKENIPRNYYLLLEAGTDLSIKDRFDGTLLVHAAAMSRYDIVLDLLNRGAEYQMVNRIGRVLLFYRLETHENMMDKSSKAYKNKKKVEQWLIEHGIDYKVEKP